MFAVAPVVDAAILAPQPRPVGAALNSLPAPASSASITLSDLDACLGPTSRLGIAITASRLSDVRIGVLDGADSRFVQLDGVPVDFPPVGACVKGFGVVYGLTQPVTTSAEWLQALFGTAVDKLWFLLGGAFESGEVRPDVPYRDFYGLTLRDPALDPEAHVFAYGTLAGNDEVRICEVGLNILDGSVLVAETPRPDNSVEALVRTAASFAVGLVLVNPDGAHALPMSRWRELTAAARAAKLRSAPSVAASWPGSCVCGQTAAGCMAQAYDMAEHQTHALHPGAELEHAPTAGGCLRDEALRPAAAPSATPGLLQGIRRAILRRGICKAAVQELMATSTTAATVFEEASTKSVRKVATQMGWATFAPLKRLSYGQYSMLEDVKRVNTLSIVL